MTKHLSPDSGWTPLRNLVVVREEAEPEQRESGLVAVRLEERGDLVRGEVVLTGPDCRDVKPGDRVLYNRWHGEEVWVGEREPALALKEGEIIAKEES